MVATLERLWNSRMGPYIGVGGVLLLVIVVQTLTQPAFATPDNLTSVGRTIAVPLVLAAAMTIVLLTGGVDLSMGSTLALSGVMYAQLVTSGTSAVAALFAAIAFGGLLGFCVNGILIGRFRISFFVVTLGTLSLYRGLVYLWTDSRTIDMFDDGVSRFVGNESVLGDRVPVPLLIAVAVVVVLAVFLRVTTLGRSTYAVGGNREAAELSGVRAGWVIALAYGISGALAGLAGVMTIGRQTIADPNMGTGLELQAAAAALLGGVALSGGLGTVWGAALGVALLEAMSNSLALAGASAAWQLIITGGILVIAVILDQVRNRAAAGAGITIPRVRDDAVADPLLAKAGKEGSG